MRELRVLTDGHLKLPFSDLKEFFEEEMLEQVRSQLKLLLEQAMLAEQDRYLDLGYYEHAPVSRLDYRNGFYFRDLVTKLGGWRTLQMLRRLWVAYPLRFCFMQRVGGSYLHDLLSGQPSRFLLSAHPSHSNRFTY